MPAEEPRMKEPSDSAQVAHDLLHEWWEESTETRALAFDDNTALLIRIKCALDAARAEGIEEAAKVAEDRIREAIRELAGESDKEKKEDGYLRFPSKGKYNDWRDGWTLYGFARNEMCVALTTVPAAIRAAKEV